jgi:hypothetical protein
VVQGKDRPDLKQEAGHCGSFPESSYTEGIGRKTIDPVKRKCE